jgi:hypothetical protein
MVRVLIAHLDVSKVLLVKGRFKGQDQKMIHRVAVAVPVGRGIQRLKIADPAFKTIAAKRVLVRFVLPEFNLHVFDLVPRNHIGKIKQLA